jgi:hypothetical protein
MPRLLERVNFPKVVTVLAITFGVALGACGITGVAAASSGGGNFLVTLAFVELAVILLSAAGLVITAIVWIVASLLGQTRSKGSNPQVPFDDSIDKKP